MPTPEIPHLALPLRLVGNRLAPLEQDSTAEIAQCVETVVRYPLGLRPEEPEFGIPDLTFREVPVGTAEIDQAVARWEPRASALAQEDPSLYDQAIAQILVNVGGGQSGY